MQLNYPTFRMFRRIDDDGSKNLDFDEFAKGVRDTGLQVTDDEAQVMFKKFDIDGSGSVNIDEFLMAIRVRNGPNSGAFFFYRKWQIYVL